MDAKASESDHSMSWEDFFGSTTDLTPTLIGIYDSFLDPNATDPTPDSNPTKNQTTPVKPKRHITKKHENEHKIRNESNFITEDRKTRGEDKDINKQDKTERDNNVIEEDKHIDLNVKPSKDSSKLSGLKLPSLSGNKSNLYSATNEMKDKPDHVEKTAFEFLSPNVKRMISSATDINSSSNPLKVQRKITGRVSVRGHKSNIPLVGATSKISQSGVDILDSVEIYDRPSTSKSKKDDFRSKIADKQIIVKETPTEANDESKEVKELIKIPEKDEFKTDFETYDVPTNQQSIYDVPVPSRTTLDSLSLPYIDQSIEATTDREFDTKISKENLSKTPQKRNPNRNALKLNATLQTALNTGTNSLNRKDTKTTAVNYIEAVKSTEDLAKPLIAPIVEVTRPLSLSSIASSSSSSSLPHKGVNSAYLASIESLDDHSDLDVTSGGSNNFVNSTGNLENSVMHDLVVLEESPSPLQRVCAEIVHTENVYVEHLRQVVQGYLEIWRRESTFSSEDLQDLFNNIEDIYQFNRSFCEELNSCQLEPTSIARCFVENTSGFRIYTSYCTGYPKTMERLAILASCDHSTRFFRERQAALGHALPLASYLLKPVQRILKYHLLLQNLVKQYRSRDTEYALSKMTGIAQHIDDMKRKHEHAVRVQEIQSLLYGWNGPDLTTYGELCAEGTFRVFGAKAMRHVFLFDKMLLVTKNREDGVLAYKSHIMCNNLMLVEAIAGAPLCFHVIPWDAPRAQLTLQARSQRHKREWTLLLKRVILENYNAVIPSHARQLVMELGQNKTDDDILAEKSHGLMTQASMRKQLSAPEYLEKRKLERDRRKTDLIKLNKNNTFSETAENCDCPKVSTENDVDYVCDGCFVDVCSDCEVDSRNNRSLSRDRTDIKKSIRSNKQTKPNKAEIIRSRGLSSDRGDPNKETAFNKNCDKETQLLRQSSKEIKVDNSDNDKEIDTKDDKCNECNGSLSYIDAGSLEMLENHNCQCPNVKSSQESINKETNLNVNKRTFYSTDNIMNDSITKIPRTCLKCAKIKENIIVDKATLKRNSRCCEQEKIRCDARSKSKEDHHRTKLSKIGPWRRKSEPGLPQNFPNANELQKNTVNNKNINEKYEFECKHCGSRKITRKTKTDVSDTEIDNKGNKKGNLEVKMYTSKNIPKKISKIKKNRSKKHDAAKFYADLSDVSTENILHITESTDSINTVHREMSTEDVPLAVTENISKDTDIDDETYKKLIEKTDSFKKNELEKTKFLNQQKVINEGSESEADLNKNAAQAEPEKPLEEIISQLLMQNREFQKILKKQQLRNTAQKRHQRLLKSHSTPEPAIRPKFLAPETTIRPKFHRLHSDSSHNYKVFDSNTVSSIENQNYVSVDVLEDEHIYETLRVETKVNQNQQDKERNTGDVKHQKYADLESKRDVENYKGEIKSNKRIVDEITRNDIFDNEEENEHDTIFLSKRDTQTATDLKHEHSDNTVKGNQANKDMNEKNIINEQDADYIYLTIEQKHQNEGIYDVPMNLYKTKESNEKNPKLDYYVPMKPQENIYDNVTEVKRREKDINKQNHESTGYMDMGVGKHRDFLAIDNPENADSSPIVDEKHKKNSYMAVSDQKNQNTTEIWLSKQKEHFNVPRDRKSGSLPRSFQILTQDDDALTSFKTASKIYLNRDGKILNIDRPFTIASDKSEMNYEDLDPNDFFKFGTTHKTVEYENPDDLEQISKSTMELVKEMDLCYEKNIGSIDPVDLKDKNLEVSINSSCEVLNDKSVQEKSGLTLPEHKIYKATNVLSLRNVLNRFKINNKKNISDENLNKSISPEKKTGLNSKSYSKNLLHRFKNIIGDEDKNEHIKDTEQNSVGDRVESIKHEQSDVNGHSRKENSKEQQSLIKVVITNSDDRIKSSTEIKANAAQFSQNTDQVKTNLTNENLFIKNAQKFDRVDSTVSNTSFSSNSSYTTSKNNSYQSLNKLPIYKQGSKHLGARIAQSYYEDPTELNKNTVNVLINKNSVRPDSLFSNASFVSEKSADVDRFSQNTDRFSQDAEPISRNNDVLNKYTHKFSPSKNIKDSSNKSDECVYEKSFERIEQILDCEIYRDSAIYSEPEGIEQKYQCTNKTEHHNLKTVHHGTKAEHSKQTDKQDQIYTNKSSLYKMKSTNEDETINQTIAATNDDLAKEAVRSKIAPPVPIKPKVFSVTDIVVKDKKNNPNDKTLKSPVKTSKSTENVLQNIENINKTLITESSENKSKLNAVNKYIETDQRHLNDTFKAVPVKSTFNEGDKVQNELKRNAFERMSANKSKPTIASPDKPKIQSKTLSKEIKSEDFTKNEETVKNSSSKSEYQIKRLSFERTSLNAIRKTSEPNVSLNLKFNTADAQKSTSKTVQERRLEIESLSQKFDEKNKNRRVGIPVKTGPKPKGVCFRSISHTGESITEKRQLENAEKQNIVRNSSHIDERETYNQRGTNLRRSDKNINTRLANDGMLSEHIKIDRMTAEKTKMTAAKTLNDRMTFSPTKNDSMTTENPIITRMTTEGTSSDLTFKRMTAERVSSRLVTASRVGVTALNTTDDRVTAVNQSLNTDRHLESKASWVKQVVNKFQ